MVQSFKVSVCTDRYFLFEMNISNTTYKNSNKTVDISEIYAIIVNVKRNGETKKKQLNSLTNYQLLLHNFTNAANVKII